MDTSEPKIPDYVKMIAFGVSSVFFMFCSVSLLVWAFSDKEYDHDIIREFTTEFNTEFCRASIGERFCTKKFMRRDSIVECGRIEFVRVSGGYIVIDNWGDIENNDIIEYECK